MSRKIISESIPKAIADEVRKKRGITSQMRVSDIAAEVAKIRLGCPIVVSNRIGARGALERPEEWANLDSLPKENNTIYLTIDNSGRIDDAHLSVSMTTASGQYTAEVGNVVDGVFVGGAATSYNSGATCLISDWGGVSYPVVKLKAVGGFANMDFKAATINGHTYVARYNAVVEASGHIGEHRGGVYGTYFLERDSRRIGLINGNSFQYAWQYCYSLQSLDLSGWDTTNWMVTSMANTWQYCYSLQSLDLSGWDTTNWSVTSMANTWNGCFSLQSIDLSGWDTTNWSVTSLLSTWQHCNSLQSLDLSGWDTINWKVTLFSSTWNYCYSLQSLNLSGWDTTNWSVTSLSSTWNSCYSLQSLDLSGWDTTNWSVTSMSGTWTSCYSLQSLDLSGWDTTNWSVTSLSSTWNSCYSLHEISMDSMLNVNTNISYSRYLSRQCIIDIFNTLPTISSAKTLTIGSENLGKMTTEEKAIATSKGWTLA